MEQTKKLVEKLTKKIDKLNITLKKLQQKRKELKRHIYNIEVAKPRRQEKRKKQIEQEGEYIQKNSIVYKKFHKKLKDLSEIEKYKYSNDMQREKRLKNGQNIRMYYKIVDSDHIALSYDKYFTEIYKTSIYIQNVATKEHRKIREKLIEEGDIGKKYQLSRIKED